MKVKFNTVHSIGTKHDTEKPRWDLLPFDTVEDVVKVLTYGAKKYSENNWKEVKPKERYFSAAMRHMIAWQSKEQNDPESNLPHLAHALCSLLFLHWLDTHDVNSELKVILSETVRSKYKRGVYGETLISHCPLPPRIKNTLASAGMQMIVISQRLEYLVYIRREKTQERLSMKFDTKQEQKRWDSFKVPKGYIEVFPPSPMNWKLIEGRQIIFYRGFGHCLEVRKKFKKGE